MSKDEDYPCVERTDFLPAGGVKVTTMHSIQFSTKSMSCSYSNNE